MFGHLSSEEIESVIKGQVIGRLGCHTGGITYVVPISYAYDGQYLYGHTQEGMKIQMMRKNPEVCVEIDEMHDMGNWKSVISWGIYEELTDPTSRLNALEILHARILPLVHSATTQLSPEWPFVPGDMNAIKGVVYRIRIKQKTGRFENNTVPSFLAWG